MTTTSAFAQHKDAAQRAYDATIWQDAVPDFEAALSLIAASEAPATDEALLLTQLGTCYWNLAEHAPRGARYAGRSASAATATTGSG